MAELRRDRELAHPDSERAAFLVLIGEEERRATELLKARSIWAELKEFDTTEQLQRVRSRSSWQTVSLFQLIAGEARSLASSDPYLAEQHALTAEALAQALPDTRFSKQFKRDRQGEALILVANCRRLAADWTGSLKALKAAKAHLTSGTGDPLLSARLLSIQASLLSDTGRTEAALELLGQAVEILRTEEETDELCSCLLKLAGTLLADNKPEEALVQAREVVQFLAGTPVPRREVLARGIMVESLLELERPVEALHEYWFHKRLFEEQATQGLKLQISYLEAKLLEGLDCVRESDRLFRKVIDGYVEAELYKECFRVSLTLFESYFRRSRLDKAAKLCQESIGMLQECGGHKQMVAAWEELFHLVVNQGLERRHLVEARQYLARHWHQPASSPPFSGKDPILREPEESRLELESSPASLGRIESEEESIAPSSPDPLSGGLHAALEFHEREYISMALSRAGGSIREAAKILGVSRNGLRPKLKKLGIIVERDEPE